MSKLENFSLIGLIFLFSACATKVHKGDVVSIPTPPASEQRPIDKYFVVKSPPAPFNAPAAIRLFDAQDFVRKSPAPDFWAIMPYYIPQKKGTCTASSIAIILNALNVHKKTSSTEKLVTSEDLIAAVADKGWEVSMKEEKCYGLDSLGDILRLALQKFGHSRAIVETIHVNDQSPQTRQLVHRDLVENEKSDRDFILANFLQEQFTGDPEGMEGHFSLVGAYDAANRRVLIMDVDRDYYEPYWVTEDNFLAGMNTKHESSPAYRGYFKIRDDVH